MELTTVKKGTPLYGQPSWWGEDEEDNSADTSTPSPAKLAGEKCEDGVSKRSRPNSLSLSEGPGASRQVVGEKMDHRHSNVTYMEIPIKDLVEDVESPEDDETLRERDTTTPAKSITSSLSLSKDSLFSPDSKAKEIKASSPGAEKNPAMSFTIDLDDHQPRKVNPNASLSEFLPPKLRKNFRDRKDRVVSTRSNSKESTPSKNSEERELSPTQQRKIDEMWSTVESKAKVSRLSSIGASIGSSTLRSPNLEDIDLISELSSEKGSKVLDKDGEKKGRRPLPSKSPQTAKSARGKGSSVSSSTGSAGANKSSKVSPPTAKSSAQTKVSPPVSHSLYSDPTSYLIDKMFEGGQSSSNPSSKEPSPEQKRQREAVGHNRTKPGGAKTTNVSAKNDLKSSSTKLPQKVAVGSKKSHAADCVDNKVEEDVDDLRITEADGVKEEDKEDKASEAGTYTIEADLKEDEGEEEARKRIDQVFGVDVDTFVDRPVIDPKRMDSPGGYDNVPQIDGDKTPMEATSYFPEFSKDEGLEEDNEDVDEDMEDDDLLVEDDGEEPESPGMATADGVQTWVSQLTALTNHKSAGMAADQGKVARDDGGTSLSKKPPQGINRKRPGTGRKLPTIPTTDRSPVSSEHSSYLGDHPEHSSYLADHPDLHIADDVSATDIIVNGKNNVLNSKPSRISSQVSAKVRNNGHVEMPSHDAISPASTSRSRGSVDTELLLQDTETVMAAMEARIGHHKAAQPRGYSPNSDTDVSSTVAMVNGDDDYVKPSVYNSPRDALAKRRSTRDAWSKGSSSVGGVASTPPANSATQKRTIGRSYSQTVASKSKAAASPRSATTAASGTKKSIVSDVHSRAESVDDDSIISDVSSDHGDTSFSRTGSQGKGGVPMSMTKPNRAFQLRRARADSFEDPPTPRSGKSTGRSNASTGSSARSSSVHSSAPRRSLQNTHRSDATTTSSLGTQIVRKSRENAGEKTKNNNNMTRADGGRHSLRLQRASSLTIPQGGPANTTTGKRETTPKREFTPKSQLKSSGGSNSRGNLAVTGVSSNSISSRSQSQPGSRSNSPKAAERMAWKRRKEYDPRRAVAEAKAKSKDPVTPGSNTSYGVTARPKPSASSNYKRRMIRSASFTNSAELKMSVQTALSASQDYVAGGDRHEHEGFRRAFIPFHNSLRTDRSAYSADEDDSILSATSTQASYDTLIVSSIYQLSLKLKSATDKTMLKLREQDRLSLTPSPIDDFLSDSAKSEITAWKTANQELAGVLKNLRRIERHCLVMDRVLFPDEDTESDVSSALRVGQNYVQEIERIRNEIKGFQPIEPVDQEVASPEMAELTSGQF